MYLGEQVIQKKSNEKPLLFFLYCKNTIIIYCARQIPL